MVTYTSTTPKRIDPNTLLNPALNTGINSTAAGGFIPATKVADINDTMGGALDALSNIPTTNLAAQQGQGYLNEAAGLASKAGKVDLSGMLKIFTDNLNAGNQAYDPSTASRYMDPYIDSVITPALERLNKQRMGVQDSIGSNASAVNAFGGAREGVQRSANDVGFDLNTASFLGDQYSSGYDKALSNDMSQFNAERGRNLTSAGLGLQGTSPLLEEGRLGLSSAQTLANIGQQLYGTGGTDIDRTIEAAKSKLGAGGVVRDYQQQLLDAFNTEQKTQDDYLYNTLMKYKEVLGAFPTGGVSSSTGSNTNLISELAKVLGTAALPSTQAK